MCGIFAYFNKQPDENTVKLAKESRDVIKYRGPDHSSYETLYRNGIMISLAFHRLAIIDTSEKSDSMLHDGGVYLTCNGEIYNYKFLIKKYSLDMHTGSDCEVILQLYRRDPGLFPDILQELDGVFAFVLVDYERGQVIAARDRLGVRPLFIGESTGTAIGFASEGKALKLLQNSEQFTPGQCLFFDMNDWSTRVVRWFHLEGHLNMDYKVSQNIVRELLVAGVRKRLMSDRPIGFLLSGGLDSSLVASIASRHLAEPITTFSIGLPGSPDLIAAKKVAQYLNSIHHEIVVSTQDILAALPKVVFHDETYDITTIRASIPMYLLAKYIRERTDIKVIFSGEGSDELFGGYLYFHKAPSPQEFQAETHRLLRELYKFDLLRGDRTTAAWGLEIRVPFLDAALLSVVAQMEPTLKMPREGVEKALLRDAFKGYLPDEILCRQKEAFSDGVGYSSVASLKSRAEKEHSELKSHPPKGVAHPHTPESNMYWHLFKDHYTHPGLHTEYYWMPRWHHNVTDPSATVLGVHSSKKVN